ncbi:uridine diphosphate glucose pyrophosphatase NUDT22 isoform X1 [Petromyzon marinus]|uniref:uridine diphosphate glucose pyrophosphatase NUDT22 isoform X1 n=3 Tax=Petromyzon marinus TaxID=7757 RepID=UPI003F72B1C5
MLAVCEISSSGRRVHSHRSTITRIRHLFKNPQVKGTSMWRLGAVVRYKLNHPYTRGSNNSCITINSDHSISSSNNNFVSRRNGGRGSCSSTSGENGAMHDPDISLMLVAPSAACMPLENVRVELSSRYCRAVLPEHEPRVSEIWQARMRHQPWLYNGSKFRLHSAEMEADGTLRMRLGLTCYRDFLGTNWAAEARRLQEHGERDAGSSQAYLAEPLGVGAVLVTADGQGVFLRRSHMVGEAAGQIDIPGGHPEPKAVAPGGDDERLRPEDLQPELVARELYDSILAEIRDEVNLPLACLSPPLLMGIARNNTSAGRPSAEFYVRCSLDSEEVRVLYLQGGPEAQESTNIVFIPRERLSTLERDSSVWGELCPSAKGGVRLFSLLGPDLGDDRPWRGGVELPGGNTNGTS